MDENTEDVDFLHLSNVHRKRLQCAPNYFLLPTKICYLLKQAKFAVLDFTMLFYINIGLNSAEAGMINGIQNIGGVIGAPLWALVADKFKIHKPLCMLLSIASTITFCIQPILPLFFGETYVNRCPLVKGNETSAPLLADSSQSHHRILFYALLSASVIASSFDGSVMSFVDSAVLQRVRTSPVHTEYGKQRILGCVGTASGTFLYAFGVQFFPVNYVTSCYTGLFIGYFLLSVVFSVSCFFLYKGLLFTRNQDPIHLGGDETTLKSDDVTRHVTHLLLNTLRQFETIFFMLNVFILGILQASYYTFTFMYLQQELDAPTFLFPISMTLSAFAGVLVYYYGSRVIEFINGAENAFCIIYFFWTIRYVWLASIKNPFYVLFTDMLTSVTYSLGVLITIEQIQKISDPAILTTMSGLRNCLYNYLGYLLASVGGGIVTRVYGGRTLFISLAVLSAISFFVIVIYIGASNLSKTSCSCMSNTNYQPIK